MSWGSWGEERDVTVSVGRDLLYASMLGHVMGRLGLSSIPVELLAKHAKEVLSKHCMYSEDEGIVNIFPSGDCLNAGGGFVLGAGTFADGLVQVDATQEHIVACEDATVEDLMEFVSRACDGNVYLEHVMGGRGWGHWLIKDVLCHAMGTQEMDVDNIPSGKPLILMDIDDCINVLACEPEWYENSPLPDGDAYETDMRSLATFPKELVALERESGRHIPETMAVRWSSELADDIKFLADETGATFVWLSSWMECSRAMELLLWSDGDSPFTGYLEWHRRGMSDDGRYGKVLRVSELFGNPRTKYEREEMIAAGIACTDGDMPDSPSIDVPCLVVIDDKGISGAYDGPYEGHDLFATAVGDVVDELTISPDFRYGISRPEWRRVVEFVRAHA